MSLLFDVASEHQARRIALAQRTSNRVRAVWGQADVASLDVSWAVLAPEMTAHVVDAQVSAAGQSGPYLDRVSRATGHDAARAGLNPVSFGGSMLDGRDVGPALFGAVTTTKKAIGAGMAPRMAFQSGAAFLSVLVKAAVADAGRGADAALATGRGYVRYIRVVSPGACSRCAILAGSDRFSRPFLRHPACKCTSLPLDSAGKLPEGVFANPKEYFDSLSAAEQDRVFTNAGAKSIRLGADPISVVNSKRGYTRPPKGVSGDAVRSPFRSGVGFGYRRSGPPRLMPETIIAEAGSDHELAVRMLREHGYIH